MNAPVRKGRELDIGPLPKKAEPAVSAPKPAPQQKGPYRARYASTSPDVPAPPPMPKITMTENPAFATVDVTISLTQQMLIDLPPGTVFNVVYLGGGKFSIIRG